MSEGERKTEAPKEHPVMGQIVGYLKDYPFLLITIAGLLILSGLKEFKWVVGRSVAFRYVYDGDLVQSAWSRR